MTATVGATVLFEPLPIARLGVRRDDDEVVLGNDFSTFSYMLEDFVSLGTYKIAIPRSYPEAAGLASAPALLAERIWVVDDTAEVQSADRLLQPLMQELRIAVDSESGRLKAPRDLPRSVLAAIRQTHRDIISFALGLNKSMQIELNPARTRAAARELRRIAQVPESRALLASVEGLFAHYENVEFNAATPPAEAPLAMIELFDRLAHDPQYLEYSSAVAMLDDRDARGLVLSRVQTIGRKIVSANLGVTGWNFIAKLLKAQTGIPIPDASGLSSLVAGKSLPTILDLDQARRRAFDMWVSSGDHAVVRDRSAKPFAEGEVDWLPPSKSASISPLVAATRSLGTAGELLQTLQALEEAPGSGRS